MLFTTVLGGVAHVPSRGLQAVRGSPIRRCANLKGQIPLFPQSAPQLVAKIPLGR